MTTDSGTVPGRVTQRVTGTVSGTLNSGYHSSPEPPYSPAPTPTPSTKTPSVRDRAVTREAIVDWRDSLADVVQMIRPDWKWRIVRAALGRSKDAAPMEVILNAISAAADTSTHHPARIEFYDRRQPGYAPPPYIAEHVDVVAMPAEVRAALTDPKPLPAGRPEK